MSETIFLARDIPSMVIVNLAPVGDGSRTVCVWTWPEGPDPVQHRPFQVPSLEVARALVPSGSFMVTSAPAGFAEEAWLHVPKGQVLRRI